MLSSNALDFLPLDRSGNRRFIPVMVYPEQAEVHILEDEAASRAYIGQMWAEAMEIYKSGRFKLAFSPAMQRYLKEHQRDFMPEDTKAGMIQAYLDRVVTKKTTARIQLDENGEFVRNPEEDLVKVAVVERHQGTGNVACGFLKGYGIKEGAVALSVAHDRLSQRSRIFVWAIPGREAQPPCKILVP